MWWIIVPILVLPMTSHGRMECSKREYDKCIRIADPLVKEPHLVFPDNLDDIDQVCRTWNQFVDCLKTYTDACFTPQQRKQFNRAVESPIESVHQMCMQPSYQREYLQHASCIKNTIIQRSHCGLQYNLLVDQVDQGDITSKSTLCCSHDRFKQCIQRETRRICDRGISDGPANRFATQIIDKALSFLQDQCYNYIPNSGDCAVPTADSLPYADRTDPLMISTSSSEVYPWSTIQQEAVQKEILPDRVTPPKPPTPSSWLPSSVAPSSGRIPSTDASSTQILGSRTRPASYGRASSWSSENTPSVGGNTVQMYPELPSTPSTRSDWATVRAWNVGGQAPGIQSGTTRNFETSNSYPYESTSSTSGVSESTTWYPAAGNQLSNEVEEPNQLGLQKPRHNNAVTISATALPLLISLTHVLVAVRNF
ncbi:uncharacterized protein LOC108904399 [Anoplophora glabripennis]|uniref:uncharacterized protein LOC108904399 n=1 Tax=Anoplophora glabripennis TaxID=217634 RepID=UPI000874B766|nr:uncharacterized protein LOC108904399 [Anoplophora glabripennis]